MSTREKKDIQRFEVDFASGLTTEQVNQRIKDKLTNKTKKVYGKSYLEIIFTDIFSFFNIILAVLGGLIIFSGVKSIGSLFFLWILFCNIVIALYEDIKARILMGKMSVLTQNKITVIRDGKKVQILPKEIVLDDIVLLTASEQIPVDGTIVSGHVLVNESLLTGESQNIEKNTANCVYSGSFVVSGEAYLRAEKIGNESYAHTIENKANKFKRSDSQILKSLKGLFLCVGITTVIIGILTCVVYGVQGSFSTVLEFKESIGPIAGSLVGMIPSGLYLLTSMSLATGVITLAGKRAQVQDFYAVEMLARTNVLCVDKTGTITDGSMKVKSLDVLTKGISRDDIEQIISNILIATKDNNATAEALRKEFSYQLSAEIVTELPFNSINKYSGATFKGGNTYFIGAPEFLSFTNKEEVISLAGKYVEHGYRVLVLVKSPNVIRDNKAQGIGHALALIVLEDNIKEDVNKTFDWFVKNGVEIKVISGDNARAVSEIAKNAGVINAERYISLENKTIEEVKQLALEYTVFGRVNPEQKEAIILALREANKTVAMTGDGINDILALKRANCSIAMASGAESARNVSHLVLLDSNFNALPDVVAEGRRVVNNLQRTSSLFLSKTIFVISLSIAFLLASLFSNNSDIRYPFETHHLLIWEILGIGLSAFFIALQKNDELVKGKFIINTIKKAIPTGGTITLCVFVLFGLYHLQIHKNLYTGIGSMDTVVSMSVLTFSVLGFAGLYRVCMPMKKNRFILFLIFSIIGAICVFFTAIRGYFNDKGNMFGIVYQSLEPINYLVIIGILIIAITAYFSITKLVTFLKEDSNNVKD